VTRPRGLPELVFALPAAAALVLIGAEPATSTRSAIRGLLPTVAFLGLILTFGHLCAEVGVFDYLGALAARASHGRPPRLLAIVVAIASVVTAVLTLDATVVLLTPVVFRTVRRLEVPARPHLYACAQLANAGSLLLPVSNLTNLLAFTASGLSFGRFAALMAVPWVVAGLLELVGLRLFFRSDLRAVSVESVEPVSAPRYGLAVLGLTVAGFVVTSGLDVAPAWAALAGAVLLGAPQIARRRSTVPRLVAEANLGFCAFVLCLGVIVDAVTRHGLGDALGRIVPHGTSLPELLVLAFLGALAANLANNLPATLALTPLVAGHPTAVLAVLLGVNIGPNATYAGSLATLLWRRLLPSDERPLATQFHAYGLLSVPPILAAATVALWASAVL
jgi:arsenical pump membrane protein